ncbi:MULTISPECIES: hypothetical protein [Sporosarcina]|uniref:YfhD-like protein n=1 Tax=Sporosarcina saromensis TaxID=359365 RepID=A0ABU4GAW6_9BACL|nr:hypothetical protein [Sporosarcina saromensis]MDW0114139.1 hypothetical protein [Sporosarcina saromensis]
MAKEKKKKMKKGNTLDREEFGYGFDISPDDFEVIGKNNQANKQKDTEKDTEKHRPPTN